MKENQLSLHVRDTMQIAKHKLQTLRKSIDKIDEENDELLNRIEQEKQA